MKLAAIDFEYTDGHLAHPRLVCACLMVEGCDPEKYWLYDGSDNAKLVGRIQELKSQCAFVAHAVELAEGRCFVELGITDQDIRWWDTMLVEHMTTNKARRESRISLSLVDTLHRHKLVGDDPEEIRAYKEEMRRIIIEKVDIEGHRSSILDYCTSDIHLLAKLVRSQLQELIRLCGIDEQNTMKIPFDSKYRLDPAKVAMDASYNAWLFALIDANGIPLQKDEARQFLVGAKSGRLQLHIKFNNEVADVFDIAHRGRGKKRRVVSTLKFKKVQAFVKSIIDEHNIVGWPLSQKTGALSLKEQVLKEYEGLDPRLEAFRRMRKTDKMLSSFAKSGEGNWLASFDPETSRVYAYHGYGLTQTYRNTAKPSSGFVPLWSRAMRTLMMPPKGKALVAVDYSSEEFILGADTYRDEAGIDAYRRGDIYIATAQKISLLPEGAKKGDILPSGERVKDIRQRVKQLVLGLGYGMGHKSLAMRLGTDEFDAKELRERYMDLYHATYDKHAEIKRDLKHRQLLFELPNGYMIEARGETDRKREDGSYVDATLSSINWIIQASGAYILQSIVRRCFARGLKVITTIHDEVVIEADADKAEEAAKQLSEIMVDAYEELTGTRNVRTGEAEIWGEFNGKRCDHNEDGNKAYNELLELVSRSTASDGISIGQDPEIWADDLNDNN